MKCLISPKGAAESNNPPFGFTSLVLQFAFPPPAVWWLNPGAWATGLIRTLSIQRSPTCSSVTFVGLGRNEIGCLLGLFTAQPSWLPALGHPLCPRVMTLVRDNLPAGTSQSTMNGLGPGAGFPPSPQISGHPCRVQALAWAWGRGCLYLADPGRLPGSLSAHE